MKKTLYTFAFVAFAGIICNAQTTVTDAQRAAVNQEAVNADGTIRTTVVAADAEAQPAPAQGERAAGDVPANTQTRRAAPVAAPADAKPASQPATQEKGKTTITPR